ncbi:MAG: Uma2 family endonuclease, partial [Lachnospiraceae bacterium]|nr:Uma2 family endonuclease [Lachnospiraceae bacterium]
EINMEKKKAGLSMQIEEMRLWKYKIGMTAEDIATASGVPLSTVQKIFSGVTKNPRKSTMDAVIAVLRQEAEKRGGEMAVREPAVAYGVRKNEVKGIPESAMDVACAVSNISDSQVYDPENRSGTYTLEDYYALPDEQRVELIDGVFYNMAAPALVHQLILLELAILFRECIDAHEGACEVYVAPCDVRLDMDNRTMVQPDLLIVCEEYGIDAKRIEGAPALTVEILSPSTRSKDMLLKLYKYANAGVREYWVVDPEERVVLVYNLEQQVYYPKRYSFQDDIPIGISKGECSIDFSKVLKRIERHRR